MKSNTKNIFELGLLFEKVQAESVFPDNKTFPDCIAKDSLDIINEAFLQEKDRESFDLKAFVMKHFDLPVNRTAAYESDKNHSIEQHLQALWAVLTREPEQENSSLIPLPKPYIVPGGRFGEVYYWDSYFTMLGLRASGRIDMIESMVENFSYLIEKIGHIPNGNRSYYVGRSQPPFYSLMVKLLSDEKGLGVLVKHLPYLKKEYDFWMNGKEKLTAENNALHRVVLMQNGAILNRFWDENNTPRPESFKEDVELSHQSTQEASVLFRNLRAAAESGWDFSSRWFKEPDSFASIHTTDIIPIDLNCLLYHLEDTLSATYSLLDDNEEANKYATLAQNRKNAIQKYMWNETEGFYFDYDFVANQAKTHLTLAAAFPLYFKIAEQNQVQKISEHLEAKFLKSGGLLTTIARTGQQWDSPNGWAPLQWIAYKGLLNYKFDDLANKIRQNWLQLNRRVYEQTGKMTEKYNVLDESLSAGGGEYPNQDGFGWTNGVYLAMTHING
ncbi:alpha,alpha-trehalase [Emticicia sediminis]